MSTPDTSHPRRHGRGVECADRRPTPTTRALAPSPRLPGPPDRRPRAGGHHPDCDHAAAGGLDALWKAVVPETRTRGNDIHLPISLAFAERLCRAYPDADARTGAGGRAAARHRLGARGRVADHLRRLRRRLAQGRHPLRTRGRGLQGGPPGAAAAWATPPSSSSGSARSSTATTPGMWPTRWRTP